jgi:hypothetical protein
MFEVYYLLGIINSMIMNHVPLFWYVPVFTLGMITERYYRTLDRVKYHLNIFRAFVYTLVRYWFFNSFQIFILYYNKYVYNVYKRLRGVEQEVNETEVETVNEPEPEPELENEPDLNEPVVNEPAVNEPAVNEPAVNEPDLDEPKQAYTYWGVENENENENDNLYESSLKRRMSIS